MFRPHLASSLEALIQLPRLLTPYFIVLFIFALFAASKLPRKLGAKLPDQVKTLGYAGIWLFSLMSLAASTYNPFIYFRF